MLERVLRKVRTGEMPPLGLPAPDAATGAGFTNWLEGQLDQASAAKPNPGAPAIHRMNRAEYSNAVRDLLALDIDHKGLAAAGRFGLRVRQYRRRADGLSAAHGEVHEHGAEDCAAGAGNREGRRGHREVFVPGAARDDR